MIFAKGRGRRYVDERAHRSTDDWCAKAGGNRAGEDVGVSKCTLYAWKVKYGGMEVSEAQEGEAVAGGEQLAAQAGGRSESGQRSAAVGDRKKPLELVALKAAAEQMKQEHAFSERRACRLMMLTATTYRYRNQRTDEALRTRLVELAREKPRAAAAKWRTREPRAIASDLWRGWTDDTAEEAQALRVRRATAADVDGGESGVGAGFCSRGGSVWTSDPGAECGGCCTRECLALEVDTSFASRRVTRVGGDCGRARAAPSDSLRQRTRADEPTFSGVVCGATGRASAYSAGKGLRTRTWKVFMDACETNV